MSPLDFCVNVMAKSVIYLRVWSHLLKKSLKILVMIPIMHCFERLLWILYWKQFCFKDYYAFLYATLIRNAWLKSVKNWVNAKQHPEAKLLLFENYTLSSSTWSFKNNRTYFNKIRKRTSVSVLMRLND